MAINPTEAQKTFAKAIILEGMNQSDAFRKAYPEYAKRIDNVSKLSRAAYHKLHSPGVQAVMAELKARNAEMFAEVVSRESLIKDVAELIKVAKKSAYVTVSDEHGKKTVVLNDKAANVLLKALERAAKMIGADEPEKVQNDVIVSFEGDFSEYDG